MGHSPLLHLLQEHHMLVVGTNPTRKQGGFLSGGRVPGATQQQHPGATRGPQAVGDKGFSHSTPMQKGGLEGTQEPEQKPRAGPGVGVCKFFSAAQGYCPTPEPKPMALTHTGQVLFPWVQGHGESKTCQGSSVPKQIKVGMCRTDIVKI